MSSASVSPLAPKSYPGMPAIDGLRIATAKAGIKYKDRVDLMAMVFDAGTAVAGVFTTSKCPSAPVELCRAHLPGGKARVLVVNAGNANAFTGKKGRHTTAVAARAAAEAAGCNESEVFLSSTGVIGEPLDPVHFERHLKGMVADAKGERWGDAAHAIMTTDTFPKMVTRTVRLGDAEVTINGIAKGAGMIAPDMATMLAYVATDAPVSRGGFAGSAVTPHADDLQCRHGRQATRRPPTRCLPSRPVLRDRGGRPKSAIRPIRVWRISPRLSPNACMRSRLTSSRTAKARPSWCAWT